MDDKTKEMLMPTPKQSQEFRNAMQAGIVRDIAIYRGGTGELRRELSAKEKAKKKKLRAQQKKSRRQNRRKRKG